jgi:hypothetical protein
MKLNPSNPKVRAQVAALLIQYQIAPTETDAGDFAVVKWIIEGKNPQERADSFREKQTRWNGKRVRLLEDGTLGRVRFIRPRNRTDIQSDKRQGTQNPSGFDACVVWSDGRKRDRLPLSKIALAKE